MSSKGKQNQVNRRNFLKTQTAVLGAAALVGSSRSVFAAGDDKIRIAVIGCGGRGSGAGSDNLKACENTEIVAVADDDVRGKRIRLLKDHADLRPQRHYVEPFVVDILVVELDLTGDAAAVDGVVHAIQAAQKGRFAAP